MVKVKSLLKTFGPIALILGALFFLSQSNKVNIFKTTPAIFKQTVIQPSEFIPIFADPKPIFFGLEPSEKFITAKFGQLFTKADVLKHRPKQIASRYNLPREYMETVYTPLFEYE
tara:strand:- start:1987 stop:2331 length:345 start_codon:yes stop_codon:yes gene_type:complete